jgi:hypothetical protein
MTRNAPFALIALIGSSLCALALAQAPMSPVRAIACAPINSKLGAALLGREVWITDNEGKSWVRAARLPLLAAIEEEKNQGVDFDISGETIKFQDESDAVEEEVRTRRMEWRDALPDIAPGDESDESDALAASPHISIADSGAWAAALDDHLFIGGPGPGVRGRIQEPGIRGMAFDGHGFLWVTTRDALILFGRDAGLSGRHRRWRLAEAGEPSLGAGGREILIPAVAGLWTASLRDKDKKPGIALCSMPKVDAAAAHPKKEQIYLVSLGRLRMYLSGGALKDLGPAPFKVDRMAVDESGMVMLFSKRVGWLEKKDGSWRPLPVVSLAIDSEGRVWQGTDRGPVGPRKKTYSLDLEKPPIRGFAQLAGDAVSVLEQTLGPPPCHSCSFGLFPRARLFFSWARGGYRYREIDFMEDRVGAYQWVYLGLELTWRFGPLKPIDCIAHNRRWRALREQRIRKLEALWRALLMAHYSKPLNEDAFEAAALMLDEARLEEIIRIQSKTY